MVHGCNLFLICIPPILLSELRGPHMNIPFTHTIPLNCHKLGPPSLSFHLILHGLILVIGLMWLLCCASSPWCSPHPNPTSANAACWMGLVSISFIVIWCDTSWMLGSSGHWYFFSMLYRCYLLIKFEHIAIKKTKVRAYWISKHVSHEHSIPTILVSSVEQTHLALTEIYQTFFLFTFDIKM